MKNSNNERNNPNLFSMLDISAGGLVTSRQIEELADGGFKTVISIAYEAHTIDEFNGITGPFPSSMEEIKIANEFGMQAVNYNVSYTASSLYSLSTDILHMPKPIFIHCHVCALFEFSFLCH